MDRDKQDGENAEDNQESDDAAVAPFILRSAPLEREKEADDADYEDESAVGIHGLDLLAPGCGSLPGLGWRDEEEENEGFGHGAEWEVCLVMSMLARRSCCTDHAWLTDIETPSPRELVRKRSSHQWSGHRSDAVHAPDHSHIRRSLSQRNRVRDNQQSTGKHASTSQTGDTSPYDQRCGVWRNTADQTAHLEDEHGG